MSYLNKEALNEYLGMHKMFVYEEQMINGELFYRNAKSGAGSMWIKKGGTGQQPTGLPGGPQVVTTSGQTEPTAPGGPGDGWWTISPQTGEWQWISLGTGTNESTSTQNSGGFAGRTLQEDLDYLAAKYGWDSKLELEMLEKEYELRGHFEDERFKDAKELQKMDAASRLAYLKEEIGLTRAMKLELMTKQHDFDKWAQDDQQTWQELENKADRDFRESESKLGRELEEKLQGLDIESRTALAAAKIAADKAMQGAGFSHDEKMQAGQQAFDKVMQEAGFENDRFLQERELTVRIAINESNITSNEKMAEKKIAADMEMQDKQISFDKEQKEEDRKLARFEAVNALRGKDPVRAALMAMGAGDALDSFGGSFADLGPMEGAEKLKTDTELALRGIEGLGAAGQTLTLGDTGVEGLQSVEKAGTAFVTSGSAGDTAVKTLVTSAQGVGGSTQAGVSEKQVQDRIAAITPAGFENRTAAGGVGPRLLQPMNSQEYAAEGRGPEVTTTPSAVAADRPAIEPNTSYVVGEGQQGDGTRPEVATTGPDKELLSIEPATDDPSLAQRRVRQDAYASGVREPYLRGERRDRGDPLVDMFNDPDLTLGRNELPPVLSEAQQNIQNFKTKQAKQMQDEMVREGLQAGAMKQIQELKASGQPLSPAQEQALAKYDRIVGQYQQSIQDFEKQTLNTGPTAPPVPELLIPTKPSPGGDDRLYPNPRERRDRRGSGVFTSQPNIDTDLAPTEQLMSDRRRAYMESLPPAQQAQIRQSQQSKLHLDQEKLVSSLTPDTIQKLMELINNPNRQVNDTLQEQLPQLRDGAGNLRQPQQNLARVV